MKEHCYWPIVSDLNNVLSHKPIAVRFMSDDTLLEMWFDFLSMFQGIILFLSSILYIITEFIIYHKVFLKLFLLYLIQE